MGREQKSERIEDIQFSPICVWLRGWKSGEMKNLFVWLRRKMRGWKSEVGINLQLCLY